MSYEVCAMTDTRIPECSERDSLRSKNARMEVPQCFVPLGRRSQKCLKDDPSKMSAHSRRDAPCPAGFAGRGSGIVDPQKTGLPGSNTYLRMPSLPMTPL